MAQVEAGAFSLRVSSFLAALPDFLRRLWLRLLELYPALRSEYIQVLIFVVVPLVLFLRALMADLRFRRRTFAEHGTVVFRPSLAVRCAWIVAIMAIVANLLSARHHWIIIAANVLALEELIRIFPRRLVVGPDGVRWRTFTGEVSLRWENLSCLSQKNSRLGTEIKLYADDGRSFTIQSMIFPAWKQIVRRISLSLAQRHLIPSPTSPQTTLEKLHRILALACLVLVIFGDRFPH